MADLLDFAPVRVLTSNAQPGAGYIARFYQSGTTTPVTVFTSAALTTPWGTSITADAEGKFAAVFSSGGAIKATIETPVGAIVATVDPVQSVPTGSSAASGVTFAPSLALPVTNVQDAIEFVRPVSLGGTGGTTPAAARTGLGATTVGAAVFTAADAAAGRTALGAQQALGFTPVEQGGGAGMGNDKIRIGWDGGSFRGNVNGTDVGRIIRNEATPDTSNGTLNAPGAPPLYACRAWVNFNGTNGSIRASGNVSSVVRNGVGDYTINFATAMPDANYAVAGFANYEPSAATAGILTAGNGYAPLAGSVRIRTGDSAAGVGQDAQFVNVVIFR
jgi:hypothetical protein